MIKTWGGALINKHKRNASKRIYREILSPFETDLLCNHCGYSIEIRNPSGYCDHLYYPDNCKVCKTSKNPTRTQSFIDEGEFKI